MIIVHENLNEEANRIAKAIEEAFGVKSRIENQNIEEVLTHIPEFNGYTFKSWELPQTRLSKVISEGKAALLLTSRDLFYQIVSRNDDWIFGACDPNNALSIASTARMKRFDNKPSEKLEVPLDRYFKRLITMSVHEVKHGTPDAEHYQPAVWVNSKTGYELPLGLHCTDNRCAMYEVVDVIAPPTNEGFMRLGNEIRYDAGLDNVIDKLHPHLFCERCRSSIKIDERFI